MAHKEFMEYLLDFLSVEDAKNLEAFALEMAEDANEGMTEDEWITEESAREHVLEMIQCGELDFDDLERIFKRKLTEEERHNMEWRF